MYQRLIGVVDPISKADATTPIPVASTGTVYTPLFNLHGADAFGLEVLAVSDGDVDVKVELEIGNVAPATVEASDGNWSEPDGMADIINVTDEVIHFKQVTPACPAKYGRFKLTGQGSNDATTTLRLKIFRQE